jgi:hypothetical protein
MSRRRTFALAAAVSTFATFAFMVCCCQASRRRPLHTAVGRQLCREHGWQLVPAARFAPPERQLRYYLCDRPRDWEELATLHQGGDLSRWKGVVLVVNLTREEAAHGDFEAVPLQHPRHARLVGRVYLFGDPVMVEAAEAATRGR